MPEKKPQAVMGSGIEPSTILLMFLAVAAATTAGVFFAVARALL